MFNINIFALTAAYLSKVYYLRLLSDPEWSGAGIVPTSQVGTSAMLLVLQIVANVVHDIEVTYVRIDFMNTGQRVQ
jgi:hypothetical protein